MDVASLKIAIQTGDIQKAEKELDKLSDQAKKTEKATDSLSLGFAAAGTVVVAAIGSMVRASIQSAIEAENASNKMQAVLKATGYAAGLTKTQLDEMADSMAKSTRFDDESIRNASAVLLTFRNVQGEAFTQGISLAADLASVLGTDLNSATLQLGKALNDPVQGISALSRAGVQFSEVQKDQIKGFVETNQLAKAQEIILGELAAQVGGTAAAMNTGLTKATSDAAKAWNEFTESLGKSREIQTGVTGSLDFISSALNKLTEDINKTGGAFAGLTQFVFRPFDLNLLGFDDGTASAKEYSDELERMQKRLASIGAEKQTQNRTDEANKATTDSLVSARMKLAGIDKSYYETLQLYQQAREQGLITDKEYVSILSELSKKVYEASTSGKKQIEQIKAQTEAQEALNKAKNQELVNAAEESVNADFESAKDLAKLQEELGRKEHEQTIQFIVDEAERRIQEDYRATEELAKAQSKVVDEQKRRQEQMVRDLQSETRGALMRAFEGGEGAFGGFAQALGSIVYSRLTQSIADSLATSALSKLGLNAAGQTAGSGMDWGSVAKTVGGFFGMSFDGGGSTGSGSRSGGMDGKGGFMAMLHPNETVIDHAKGQTGGIVYAPVISVDARSDRSDVMRTINQAIQNGHAQLVDQLQRQRRLA